MGEPGNIEAVVKFNKNEIGICSGSHRIEPNLSREKVVSFFEPIKEIKENNGWKYLNMGMGNILVIRDQYSKEFLGRYSKLVNILPYILYATWRDYADYVLNIYFNNINDVSNLEYVENCIEFLCNEYDIDEKNLYTYVSVIYEDDFIANIVDEPSYYYKTEINNIDIDDMVLVDRMGKEVVGKVVSVDYYNKDKVPYPINETKDIIKIIGHYDKEE